VAIWVQELSRILEDQSRVADEALHEADEKAKAMAKKLEVALSEIAAKDQLVKEHIKVAEDAVIGIVSPSLPRHSFLLCWPIVNDVYGILGSPKLSHEPVLHESHSISLPGDWDSCTLKSPR
jgi:hypothetical protein